MCVCVCVRHRCKRYVAHIAALAEQSSRKRARAEPKLQHLRQPRRRTKKAPPKAEQKTINAQRSCEASHSRFTAIKVPTGKLCGYAAELAHAQTEQPK